MPQNKLAPTPVNALADFYRENTDMRARTYGESLLKSFTGRTNVPITNEDFTSAQLANLDNLVKSHYAQKSAFFNRPKPDLLRDAVKLEKEAKDQVDYATRAFNPNNKNTKESYERSVRAAQKLQTQAKQLREAAEGKTPTDFAFSYDDYLPANTTDPLYRYDDPAGWNKTLGRFRYKVDPATGSYEIYDRYDFNNEALRDKGKNYAAMSAPERLITSLAATAAGNETALGQAYLSGENSIPVSIKGRLK